LPEVLLFFVIFQLTLQYLHITIATLINDMFLHIESNRVNKSLRQWTTMSLLIVSSLFIYVHTFVGGGKESVHKRAKAWCQCLYTDDCTLLKGGIFATGHFVMLHCFLTLLEQLNLHIFNVKLLQKLYGKNIRSVLLYYPWKPRWEKWKFHSQYAVKNSYNLVWQIRRNTFNIYHIFHISLIRKIKRNYLVKLIKEKSRMWCIILGSVQRAYPIESCKSLRLLIPMHLTHLPNIVKSNDLVNKFSWLLQDLICKKLISPLFKSWCP
jgi:hypothetical protein